MGGSCKCGDEPSFCIKCGEFPDWLRTSYLLKKDSTLCSEMVSPYCTVNTLPAWL